MQTIAVVNKMICTCPQQLLCCFAMQKQRCCTMDTLG